MAASRSRRRFQNENDTSSSTGPLPLDEESNSKILQINGLTDKFWLFVISFLVLLFVVVDVNYHTFPAPGTTQQALTTSHKNIFVEQYAREFLEQICEFGARHLGSEANEILAVEAITKKVRDIQQSSATTSANKIELDIQTPSGCFDLGFIGNFTTCYANVKNILVRLSPASMDTSAALLVNCHFDTALSSPGASDDMVSCAIMMEVLRVLAAADDPLRHAIVFNFNGGEETILQASHGFITQHPWAKKLKAFVNLEAAGAGGREMVFQTGPDNPWLIDTYAKSVKHPFASIIGQEIFQSGAIPADTDFRIYRDYGNIPGIDIAYTYNGYLYHTIYDLPKYIPPGCIQRGGENLLAILKALGNSDKLVDPGDAKMGKMVFFDLLGHFMVYYPQKLGDIINALVIVGVLVSLYWKIKSFKQSGRSAGLYIKLIGASYTMHAAGYLAMIIFTLTISFTINTVRPMMWFTNNWLCFPLYILPAISVWIVVHQHGRQWFSSIFHLVSIWELEAVYFEAGLLFWTILLGVMSMCGVASSYMCMLLVVFPLLIRQLVVDVFNIKMHNSPKLYLMLTAAGLLLPYLHIMQFAHNNFLFFLPLLGRIGSEVVPDVLAAILCLLPVIVYSTYLAGFLHTSKDQTILAIKFFFISLIFMFIGGYSNLGFPYSANPDSPSPQRHVLHHFWREFHAYDGSLEKSDHGLLYLPFDYNAHRYLEIDEMKSMKIQQLDPNYAYAGYPYYFPMICLLKKLYVSELARPRLSTSLDVQHSKEIIASDVVRHHFIASGDIIRVNIYMSVREGGELTGWSFTPGTPIASMMPAEMKRKHYFVYTTSSSSPHPDRKFWLDIKVPSGQTVDKHWLDIGFGVHYLDGPDSMTPELENVLNKFPNWTVPLGWVATFQHYQF